MSVEKYLDPSHPHVEEEAYVYDFLNSKIADNGLPRKSAKKLDK
jgi:hypothetical protein